jgi:inosine/xanthosine triphosphatase
MLIVVGTKNPSKIDAVKKVFMSFFSNEAIEVQGIAIKSEVPAQPIGIEQVIRGAIARAKNSQIYVNNHRDEYLQLPSFYIGIEAGLVPIPYTITGYLDYQFSVILNNAGWQSIGSGSGWEYPPEVIQQVKSNPKLEIGTIMANLSGDPQIKYRNGAIGYFSQNHLTRPQITQECIQMALIPHLNPKFYFK